MTDLKVLLLSRYGRLGASSRVRSYQYLPYLREAGIDVTAAPLLADQYIERLYEGRRQDLVRIIAAYGRRLWQLATSFRFDLLWIEAELLPWVPAWLETLLVRLGVPYVVDYDDAVFHRYDLHASSWVRRVLGGKIDQVMRQARLVMVGSDYLADRARQAGAKRVEYLPTVIDATRYRASSNGAASVYTIGWIGSPLTASSLNLVRSALGEVCAHGNARVTLVGAGRFTLDSVPIDVRPWSEATEVAELQRFDVGIMPLPDGPWERGKCGYKAIQYMACARPVVASPIGANAHIVEHGRDGLLATTPADWVAALRTLQDASLRTRMGASGRAKVERAYCIQVTAPRVASVLRSAVQSDGGR